MKDTLKVINALEQEGIIGKYAIGGAIGLLFYAEPTVTYDLDIFCYLPTVGLIISLAPLYEKLKGLGYEPTGDCVDIDGVPVQFLVPHTELVKEALEKASENHVDGVPTRVFQYEYLLAIMAETGRPKDKARIVQVLESAEPDWNKLNDILKRYQLLDKWCKITT